MQMFILCILIILTYSHDLPLHYNYELPQKSRRILESTSLNLNSTSWDTIKISYDFLQDGYIQEDVEFLIKVLNVAKSFYEKHLLVRRSGQKIKYQQYYPTTIFEVPIPDKIKDKEYDADLLFLINIDNYPQYNYLAYSAPIIFDSQTKRPIISFISWNIAYQSIGTMTNEGFESCIQIALHEITHGLGFTKQLYNQYYNYDSTYPDPIIEIANDRIYIKTPRLIATMQRHFNCTDVHSFPLEDNGGYATAGSHFERLYVYNELMTGSLLPGGFVITDFSFQLLQDTGFYRLMEYDPDILIYGKNQGCEFLNHTCHDTSFIEFCNTESEMGCTLNQRGQGMCEINDYLANGCGTQWLKDQDCRHQTASYNPQLLEYFNVDSMCIQGSLSKENLTQSYSCYQYKCSDKNTLTIIIDGNEFECGESNSIKSIDGYYGTFVCPNQNLCGIHSNSQCPNSCNSRGYCLNGKCICAKGYSGRDCLEECNELVYQNQCVKECPEKTFDNGGFCVGCPGGCEECDSYKKCKKCQSNYQLNGNFCDLQRLLNVEEKKKQEEEEELKRQEEEKLRENERQKAKEEAMEFEKTIQKNIEEYEQEQEEADKNQQEGQRENKKERVPAILIDPSVNNSLKLLNGLVYLILYFLI